MTTAIKSVQRAGAQMNRTGSRRINLRAAIPGVALIAIGVFGLGSLVLASPTAATLGTLLFLGGTFEAAGGLANLRRKDALLHVMVGVLSIEAGFIFYWMTSEALVPLTVVISGLLMSGGFVRYYLWLGRRVDVHAPAPMSAIVDLILAVLIWVAWPASVFWVLALAVGISLVFRGIHWLGLGAIALHQAEAEDVLSWMSADHLA